MDVADEVAVALVTADAFASKVTVEHDENVEVAVAEVWVAVEVNINGVEEQEVNVVEEVVEVVYFLFNLGLFVAILAYEAIVVVSISLARLAGRAYDEEDEPIRLEPLCVEDNVAVAEVL